MPVFATSASQRGCSLARDAAFSSPATRGCIIMSDVLSVSVSSEVARVDAAGNGPVAPGLSANLRDGGAFDGKSATGDVGTNHTVHVDRKRYSLCKKEKKQLNIIGPACITKLESQVCVCGGG